MTDEHRRARRRRLLLLGVLPLLLAVAFAGKVATMLVLDRDGRSAYAVAAYDDARGAFAANAFLNVLEPWVAPYDEGTARYRDHDFVAAVAALETALRDVPAANECRMRINLALAHEAVGDAAATDPEPRVAGGSWRAGLGVLAAGGCLAAGEPGEAAAVDARLRTKLAEVRDADRPGADPTDPVEAEQQSRLDDRNELGEEQRDQTEQRQEDEQAEQQAQEGGPPSPVYAW